MGNSSSTNADGSGAGSGSRRGGVRPGDSPAMRQLRLSEEPPMSPGSSSSSTTTAGPSSTSGSGPSRKASARRKKGSIDLPDHHHSQHHHHHEAKASLLRRKHSTGRRTSSIAAVDDDLDQIPVVEGTLRGAMQGKAEHVVYGPRRTASQDGSAAPSTMPSPFIKPTSIDLPPPPFAHLPLDADISGSPRLTSDVILSSEQMPVISSPPADNPPSPSPFGPSSKSTLSPDARAPPTSLTGFAETIAAQSQIDQPPPVRSDKLPSPSGGQALPPASAPSHTVLAPEIPTEGLPLGTEKIPSGTAVITSRSNAGPTTPGTPALPSPTVLLPPSLLNAPVAAIPIPLLTVPSADVAANLRAAAVDLGAGPEGVPTLIKWQDEDPPKDQAKGPKEVYVTGTFAKGWKTKIELRKTDEADFSALISLPPGAHRLKFIVDKEWKASKHLPVATDADGNLINYLQVTGTATRQVPGFTEWQNAQNQLPRAGPWAPDEDEDASTDGEDDEEWTQEIPQALVEWSEYENARDNAPPERQPAPPPTAGVPPPQLPAQLEKGPLNHAAFVAQGSGDDNSILPKPEYSVINHLAASPIKGGMLSVGITTRYKRKFITTVFFKPIPTATA